MNKIFSEKLRWISYVCSIFIVFTHTATRMPAFYSNKSGLAHFIVNYSSFLAVPAMAWFFFTSAYLFFNKYENTSNVYFDKIKKRLKTLLVPYVAWNVIAYLVSIFLYSKTNDFDFMSLLNSVVFYSFPDNLHLCFNNPMWYVFRLLTYMLLAPIFYLLCKTNMRFIVSMTIIISLCAYFNVYYYSFGHWVPIFMIGCYIGINKNVQTFFLKLVSGEFFKNKNISIVYSLIIFLLFYAIVYVLRRYFGLGEGNNYIVRLSAVIVFFICIMFVGKIKKAPSFIVAVPFFTYCTHIIIINSLLDFFKNYIVPHVSNMAIGYFIFVLMTLIVSYLILFILRKYFPKFLSILTGSR